MIFQKGHFRPREFSDIKKSHRNELLLETRNFSNRATTFKTTVFLSHKHSDLEDVSEVAGLTDLFENLGAKIYIDTMDYKLPGQTSGDTATRIKQVIKSCDKFILAATKKAIESHWCNWELGIGDTYKFKKNIAIIPIKEEGELDSNYTGNEYLQIYPRLNYHTEFTNIRGEFFKTGYYIEEPENKEGLIYTVELSKWLQQR